MRMATIRRSRGLSQAQLADLAGVEQPTISRLENGSGNITLKIVRNVARALGCTVSDLFADDRTEIEAKLIDAFRKLPEDRRRGWLDMIQVIQSDPALPTKKTR